MQDKYTNEPIEESRCRDVLVREVGELKSEAFKLDTKNVSDLESSESLKKEKLAVLRINNEKKLLLSSFEIGTLDKELILVVFTDQFVWRLGIRGREGTIWEGGLYCATIKFPRNFPEYPPVVIFDSDFEHIHIYSSGDICLDLVNKDLTYKPTVTMSLMIAEINRLIHENPNPKSPANATLNYLYLSSREEYEARIKSNARKLRDKKLI